MRTEEKAVKLLRYIMAFLCVLSLLSNSLLAGQQPTAKHAFSLVVREGFGSIRMGDLNTTLRSFNQAFDFAREISPQVLVGEINAIPDTFRDWEVELQWNAWWGFSLGISVSAPARFYGKSALTYTIVDFAGTQTEDFTYESEVRMSAPLMASLYKTFSILPRTKVALTAGIGFYRARLAQTQLWNFRLPTDATDLTSFYFDVSGRRTGFHGGVAIEYDFNNRFSILAEGLWRSAKIEHLTGSRSVREQAWDSMGNLLFSVGDSEEGPLYHYIGEDLLTGELHEWLLVNDFPPPWYGPAFPRDIREAFLDLSGFTFKIGLRIKLF